MSSNQRWAWKSLQFASLGVPVNHRCFVDGPQRVPKFIYYNPETWNQITKGKKLGVFWRLTLQFTELAHLLVLTAVSSPLTSSILSSACLCLFPAALLYVMVQVLASYLHCLTHTHTLEYKLYDVRNLCLSSWTNTAPGTGTVPGVRLIPTKLHSSVCKAVNQSDAQDRDNKVLKKDFFHSYLT